MSKCNYITSKFLLDMIQTKCPIVERLAESGAGDEIRLYSSPNRKEFFVCLVPSIADQKAGSLPSISAHRTIDAAHYDFEGLKYDFNAKEN